MKIPLDPPFTKGDNYSSLWQREVWRDLKKLFSQQFSVKINPLWYLDSERKRNLFFAKWVLGVQFCNIDISH